jgi:hypothetical protein
MSLLSELKRRNIFRVALLYIVLAWLILEVCSLAVDFLPVPIWVFRFLFAILLIGFPLALVFSWIYEITPAGLRREFEVDPQHSITSETGRKIFLAVGACLALIILMNLAGLLLSQG